MPTSIPTVASLRRVRRRLDRRRLLTNRVVATMRDGGQSLHCCFEQKPVWWLTDGMRVPNDVAELVIAHADIVPIGGALFRNVHAQTYRHVSK
jgi:hypothetical protein